MGEPPELSLPPENTASPPLALNQIVKAGDLPMPAVKVDSIGRKLESLGLGQSATPSAGMTGATPALR